MDTVRKSMATQGSNTDLLWYSRIGDNIHFLLYANARGNTGLLEYDREGENTGLLLYGSQE